MNFSSYISENLSIFLVSSCYTGSFKEQRISLFLCTRNPSFVCLFGHLKDFSPPIINVIWYPWSYSIIISTYSILWTIVHGGNMHASTWYLRSPNHQQYNYMFQCLLSVKLLVGVLPSLPCQGKELIQQVTHSLQATWYQIDVFETCVPETWSARLLQLTPPLPHPMK